MLNPITVFILNFSLSIVTLSSAIAVCFVLFLLCLKLITLIAIQAPKTESMDELFEKVKLEHLANESDNN